MRGPGGQHGVRRHARGGQLVTSGHREQGRVQRVPQHDVGHSLGRGGEYGAVPGQAPGHPRVIGRGAAPGRRDSRGIGRRLGPDGRPEAVYLAELLDLEALAAAGRPPSCSCWRRYRTRFHLIARLTDISYDCDYDADVTSATVHDFTVEGDLEGDDLVITALDVGAHVTTLLLGLAEVRTSAFFLRMNARVPYSPQAREDGRWTAAGLQVAPGIVGACHVLTRSGPVVTRATRRNPDDPPESLTV